MTENADKTRSAGSRELAKVCTYLQAAADRFDAQAKSTHAPDKAKYAAQLTARALRAISTELATGAHR